jgi:WD40 repeat protein
MGQGHKREATRVTTGGSAATCAQPRSPPNRHSVRAAALREPRVRCARARPWCAAMVKLSRLAVHKGAHEDGVWSLAWRTPPGGGAPLLLTGSVDETVKSWRVDGDGLAAVEEYTGHVLGVVSVAASASGLAAAASLDSVIRVWDLASGETQAIFETPPAEAWGLCFPPGDAGARHLASAGGVSAGVALWNLQSKERDATFALPAPVRAPRGARIALPCAAPWRNPKLGGHQAR